VWLRPKSVTETMLGWLSREADWASRSKRRAASSTCPISACRSLSATTFFIKMCSARNTAPMPPSPMRPEHAVALTTTVPTRGSGEASAISVGAMPRSLIAMASERTTGEIRARPSRRLTAPPSWVPCE